MSFKLNGMNPMQQKETSYELIKKVFASLVIFIVVMILASFVLGFTLGYYFSNLNH